MNKNDKSPIFEDISNFDTQKFIGLSDILQKNHPNKIKPMTRIYLSDELAKFNSVTTMQLKIEKLKYLILKAMYSKKQFMHQRSIELVNTINLLLEEQKLEEKLIKLIKSIPLTNDKEDLITLIVFLGSIQKASLDRVEFLKLEKVKYKLHKYGIEHDFDSKYNTEENIKDINYITGKVKEFKKSRW